MIDFVRVDSKNEDFINLVAQLDSDLANRDGDEDHAFYNQFNSISNIKYAIVLYENTKPIACGAIKHFDEETIEVKRMYTLPSHRGKGVLETGKKQPEALALYKKCNYEVTENYGQYIGISNSVCFKKRL